MNLELLAVPAQVDALLQTQSVIVSDRSSINGTGYRTIASIFAVMGLAYGSGALDVTGDLTVSGLVDEPTGISLTPVAANPGTGLAASTIWANSGDGDRLYYGADPVGAAAAGSDTEVQFNDSGAFAGDSLFTYNAGLLTVPNIALDAQLANTVFAGPGSGPDAVPDFRPLVLADIPNLSSVYLTVSAAAATYLTQANAASTYLTIAAAASGYQPLNTYLTEIAATSSITRALPFTVREAATQDGMAIEGRAGGTGSWSIIHRPATLSANRTITWADLDGVPAVSAAALTSTHIVFAGTGGVVQGSSSLTWSGTVLTNTLATVLGASYTTAGTAALGLTSTVAGDHGFLIRNLSAGTGSYTYTLTRNDSTVNFGLFNYSSGYTATNFGIVAANYGALITYGAASNGLMIGCHTVAKPIIFGVNAAEVGRFTATGAAFLLGNAAAVGSERLRVNGGTIATATATDVLIGGGSIDMGVALRYQGTQVVAARNTGWTAQTAGASKADLGASPTVGALSSFCRSLYDALAGHGLVGT